ncbi:hypothetical protein ACGFMK_23220 [Amycolatopsis sp. NPDC049252]|uniref:hypothetical protein n=1 Tax=Amycolatopsis sp. NPDC049252 TaxID=3363933 RepID=UPI0037124382
MVGTAVGQHGPIARSTVSPRALARRNAVSTAASQAGVPQPWCSGSITVWTLWWTSWISTPPNPASAI